tara:strand:- start:132 stop:389 length:258 start_codon:yes stop_codon:yes gene_type:complete
VNIQSIFIYLLKDLKMKALTHKDFRRLGFEGNNVVGYKLGNISIDIYEDEDCSDSFRASDNGISLGWVKTYEALEFILESKLIQD